MNYRIEPQLFGQPPIFSSEKLNRHMNSSQAMFGHIGLGSNIPSFQAIASDSEYATYQKLTTTFPEISDTLYVNKTTIALLPNIEDNLQVVHLGKTSRGPPKCYRRKERLLTLSRSDVTIEADFDIHMDFGRLHWEQ